MSWIWADLAVLSPWLLTAVILLGIVGICALTWRSFKRERRGEAVDRKRV